MAETTDDPDRGAVGPGAATVAFVALLVGFFTVGLATQGRSIVLGLWITEALAIALPAIVALRLANVRAAPYLGLRAPTLRHIGIAILAGLANQPVVSLLTWAARLAVPQDWADAFDSKQRALEMIFSSQAAPFLATVVIAAPFGEELFFRGFAFPALRRGIGTVAAAITTGAMFSFIHLDPVGFVGLWEIGILLALLRLGTGSLWPAVVCHAVNNGIAGGAFLLGWEDPANPPPAWLLALGGVLLVAGVVLAARIIRQPVPFAPEIADDPSAPARFYQLRSPALLAVWVGAVLVAAGQLLNVVPPVPMTGWIVLCAVAAVVVVVPALFCMAASLSVMRGDWRVARALGRAAPYLLGSSHGRSFAFHTEVFALREAGELARAVTLATSRLAEEGTPAWIRNDAIDVLISAGKYDAALRAEPPPRVPGSAHDALGLVLIQINLSEAEYNLGRWEEAEKRLRPLDRSSGMFPIARAGLLQQRAWIAAHRGRAAEALELCAAVNPGWLPATYRPEYHFTRVAALLAAGRVDEAEAALAHGEKIARRSSSKRNALFLRGEVAAARGDWVGAELHCRAAANHVFRGQGADGLLLWAQALKRVGRVEEAKEALRLAVERDPESKAAKIAASELSRADLVPG